MANADNDNYRVTIHSRLGWDGRISETERLEACHCFGGLLDALDYIQRTAECNGWRRVTLETIAEQIEIPLRGKKPIPALTWN